MRSTAIALLVLAVFASEAGAQCGLVTSECVLPSGCMSFADYSRIAYGSSFLLGGIEIFDASSCTPFPGLDESIDATFDAKANLFLVLSGQFTPFAGAAHLTVHEHTVLFNGINKTVELEVLAMDVTGGSIPSGLRLRESPTLASLGTAFTEWHGSTHLIDESLVVFTELSPDGGQTCLPASGPFNFFYELGTPTQKTTWGNVKDIYR